MIGTIVNTATILTGSLIGSVVKKGIREDPEHLTCVCCVYMSV